MCDQQKLRPACAYAQTDQSLCSSLEYSMTLRPLTEHHLEVLSQKGGCPGLSESTLVKMPHCWKSHVTAHFCFQVYNQYLEIIDGHGISAASETESREGNLYLVPGTPRCYKFSFLPLQEHVGTELEVRRHAPKLLSFFHPQHVIYHAHKC